MIFDQLATFWHLLRDSSHDVLSRLPSAEDTRRKLERERARCDRTGSCVSLVAFTVLSAESSTGSGTADRVVLGKLVRRLRKRLRSTDEIGWLDNRRIGALLPDTVPMGAWKVAQDILHDFREVPTPLVCDVYSYPHPAAPLPADSLTLPEVVGSTSLEALLAQPLPAWKRVLDMLGAGTALILLAPLLMLVALVVKVSSPGPILFRQRRSGLGGRPFILYKFRTMVQDAEARQAELRAMNEQDGPAFKIKNDPRVTPLGKFLRTSSLDELPQLWNVLKGDMSLVGPRPLPCSETAGCSGWHRQRLDVVPGLTCIWQVYGRSRVSFSEWMRMDLQYIRSRSLGQDLILLALTIPAVLLRRGAH